MTFLSGHCNPACPPKVHRLCRGGHGPTDAFVPCTCPCHTAAPETVSGGDAAHPESPRAATRPLMYDGREDDVSCGNCPRLVWPRTGYTGDAAYCPDCAPVVYGDKYQPGFDAEALADAVHGFVTAVDELNTRMKGIAAASLPWGDLLAFYDAVQTARQDASALEHDLAGLAGEALPERRQEVPGVGYVERTKGSARKAWDHEGLSGQVLDRHLTGAGGLVDPWEVRDALFKAAAVGYWRTTVLRDMGIDPDDYCETTPGRTGVRITRPG